jgi:hypothetical protein
LDLPGLNTGTHNLALKHVGRGSGSLDAPHCRDRQSTDAGQKENYMLKDFKAFLMKVNVRDLVVAVIIGAAVGAIAWELCRL